MKKFAVTATRTDNYIVQIDPTVWTETELQSWARYFYPVDNLDDLAEHIASSIMNGQPGDAFDGFGYIETFNATGKRYDAHKNRNYCAGIKVFINSHSDDFEYDIDSK